MLNINEFSGAITEFLAHLKIDRNLSPKTIRAYQYDLEMLDRWLKESEVREIGKTCFSDYHKLLNGTSLKPSTIRRKMIVLRLFVNYAIEAGLLAQDDIPMRAKVKFIVPKQLPKTMTSEHITKLLKTAHRKFLAKNTLIGKVLAKRDVAILELLYCTGIRIGELSEANLSELSITDATILIHGKGRKERLLYISNQEVMSTLQEWIALRANINPKDDALFVNRYGARLSIYGIEDVFEKALKAAGITQHSTPHSLRHSFATNLLSNGANIRDVQEILGHASIMTTQIYTEVNTERKRFVLSQYNGRNQMKLTPTGS